MKFFFVFIGLLYAKRGKATIKPRLILGPFASYEEAFSAMIDNEDMKDGEFSEIV